MSRQSELLQWGRGPETAESARVNSSGRVNPRLQWGRGPETAESAETPYLNPMISGLQWGRGPETAERTHAATAQAGSYSASMGPRSGDRGEDYFDPLVLNRTNGFNGAAVRRPRRVGRKASAAAAARASMGPRSGDRGE